MDQASHDTTITLRHCWADTQKRKEKQHYPPQEQETKKPKKYNVSNSENNSARSQIKQEIEMNIIPTSQGKPRQRNVCINIINTANLCNLYFKFYATPQSPQMPGTLFIYEWNLYTPNKIYLMILTSHVSPFLRSSPRPPRTTRAREYSAQQLAHSLDRSTSQGLPRHATHHRNRLIARHVLEPLRLHFIMLVHFCSFFTDSMYVNSPDPDDQIIQNNLTVGATLRGFPRTSCTTTRGRDHDRGPGTRKVRTVTLRRPSTYHDLARPRPYRTRKGTLDTNQPKPTHFLCIGPRNARPDHPPPRRQSRATAPPGGPPPCLSFYSGSEFGARRYQAAGYAVFHTTQPP